MLIELHTHSTLTLSLPLQYVGNAFASFCAFDVDGLYRNTQGAANGTGGGTTALRIGGIVLVSMAVLDVDQPATRTWSNPHERWNSNGHG